MHQTVSTGDSILLATVAGEEPLSGRRGTVSKRNGEVTAAGGRQSHKVAPLVTWHCATSRRAVGWARRSVSTAGIRNPTHAARRSTPRHQVRRVGHPRRASAAVLRRGQQRLAKGLPVMSSVAEARPRRGSLCSVPAVQGSQRREDDAGKAWSSHGQGQEKPLRTHGESRERRDAREIPASSSMRTAPSSRIPQTPTV